jgi:hypothetical protein
MTRTGHATGKYISRSHTTAIGLSEDIALMLDGSGLITKVSLAVIDARCHCKVKKLVIARDQYGLQLTVQHPPDKQVLYVSAPDRDRVVDRLVVWCRETRLDCTVRR